MKNGQQAAENDRVDGIIGSRPLRSAFSTAELHRRPSRHPDHAAENRALIALARQLAVSPTGILKTLAETALTLCDAQSAGISLLEPDGKRFYWPAVAGQWAAHTGGGTPRDNGPCGTVLDRNAALIFSHPERDFDYFAPVTPLVEEALLMPFYIDGKAVGTIWIIAHDGSHRFQSEDLRLITNLGTFAASAYQALVSLHAVQWVASIVESSDDAIISKDLSGIITSWNRGAERVFGYSAEEAIGRPVSMLIPVELPDEEPSILSRIRRGERIDHYQTERIRKDGSRITISLTVSPVKDANGTIVGASKIARDISEQKRADAQIAVLAREAEHRTKNILATVQATIHLTQAETALELRTAIEGRVQALANVHRLFVESRWAGAELRELVTQELAPYCSAVEVRARIEGTPLVLEPNVAQTIAVIIHELATNAAKYGALSISEGQVHVTWSPTPDGQLSLRWTESGGPPVALPEHQGFGTKVMANLIKQNKGEMRFDWKLEGLTCEITVPI